jgi:hypothetical protein
MARSAGPPVCSPEPDAMGGKMSSTGARHGWFALVHGILQTHQGEAANEDLPFAASFRLWHLWHFLRWHSIRQGRLLAKC